MALYTVLKAFRAEDIKTEIDGESVVEHCPTRKKGTVVDISGDELKFAKENDCVKPYSAKKK